MLTGCKYDPSLCRSKEFCVDDGAFGACFDEPEPVEAFVLTSEEQELVDLEMVRLRSYGASWKDPAVQCVLRNFCFTKKYGVPYDVTLCRGPDPAAVTKLLQYANDYLESVRAERGDPRRAHDMKYAALLERQRGSLRDEDLPVLLNMLNTMKLAAQDLDYPPVEETAIRVRAANEEQPGVYARGSEVADDFDSFADDMQRKNFDKKDEEILGIVDQGTGRKEHRIQTRLPHKTTTAKPPPSVSSTQFPLDKMIRRIEIDRVYIRLNKNVADPSDIEALRQNLLTSIAEPNNVTFTDFIINDNELSFKVHGKEEVNQRWLEEMFLAPPHRSPTPSIDLDAIADKAYLLMKKAGKQVLNDAEVIEAGVGSGEDRLPVRKRRDEQVFAPTIIICSVLVASFFVLLLLYLYRNRKYRKEKRPLSSIDAQGTPWLGKSSKDYEDLCRRRMSSGRTASESISGVVNSLIERLGSQKNVFDVTQPKSTHSSASSWCEEPAPNNMDISTGHMILSYLEDHLVNKGRLEEEWTALEKYEDHWTFNAASAAENQSKNRSDILPYDHSRVILSIVSNPSKSDYINANSIYDHDPRNPTYIATQGPLRSTVDDFWQMVWEQGSVVLANLTRLQENNEEKCFRYWPENGSETYSIFQVHLVSEHIWSEDYLVRSFYLKNLNTAETRTVTQFHFLTWPDGGVPLSVKSVLEFRRKVNKSYRGQACPIVIHCSDGAGRTGTYVLLDMVLNRINKGVKEVNIAATLEHLRDQRKGLVQTIEQFEFVLTCIALEVQEILKTIPEE